jgi:hypothetical protein
MVALPSVLIHQPEATNLFQRPLSMAFPTVRRKPMKKLILASAAAFVLTAGYANAGGIILGSDENDRKVWINTWAGQSEDKYARR